MCNLGRAHVSCLLQVHGLTHAGTQLPGSLNFSAITSDTHLWVHLHVVHDHAAQSSTPVVTHLLPHLEVHQHASDFAEDDTQLEAADHEGSCFMKLSKSSA